MGLCLMANTLRQTKRDIVTGGARTGERATEIGLDIRSARSCEARNVSATTAGGMVYADENEGLTNPTHPQHPTAYPATA